MFYFWCCGLEAVSQIPERSVKHRLAYARLRDPGGLAVRIAHRGSSRLPEPLVQFNVYGGPRQGFFCPEPWFGLQNSFNRGVGLVRLAPGASWEWKIEIEPEIAPAK